jgi:hypothetical protein
VRRNHDYVTNELTAAATRHRPRPRDRRLQRPCQNPGLRKIQAQVGVGATLHLRDLNKLATGLLKLLDALLWFIAKASGTYLDKLLLFAVRPFCVAIVTLAEAIARYIPMFAKETAVLSGQLADSVRKIIVLLDRARG